MSPRKVGAPSEENYEILYKDNYGGKIIYDPDQSRVIFRAKSFSNKRASTIRVETDITRDEADQRLDEFKEWL